MFRGFWRGWKYSVSYLFNTIRVVIMVSAISQLRVLASHRRKFGVCSSRRLEIRALGNGEVPFPPLPLRVWLYLLRKSAYRDFLHIILKHTQ